MRLIWRFSLIIIFVLSLSLTFLFNWHIDITQKVHSFRLTAQFNPLSVAPPTKIQAPPTAYQIPYTPTVTAIPSATATAVPTKIPTSTLTVIPTKKPTETSIVTHTAIPTDTPTALPTDIPDIPSIPTTTQTPMPTKTEIATVSPTQTPTVIVNTATAEPTLTQEIREKITPTVTPTERPIPLPTPSASGRPKNVILLIGDGMGYAQVQAAGMFFYGGTGTLSLESAPYQAEIKTASADAAITDSGAAATAMATGIKVNNQVISMAHPGDGSELETVLEYFRNRCKKTGLIATSYINHATPATFGAHNVNRSNLMEIANDYFDQTRPNLLFGGAGLGISPERAEAAGYMVAQDRKALEQIKLAVLNDDSFPFDEFYISGQFGLDHMAFEYDYAIGGVDFYDTQPHLSEMAVTALELLESDPDGFFLMIEGGRIDHASHENHLERTIYETVEFANTVQKVLDWAAGRGDTLIIVTADHETGGLVLERNNGQGNWPTAQWRTNQHTDVPVPIYAWGPNATRVKGKLDNTDVYQIMIENSNASRRCTFGMPFPEMIYLPVILH